MWSSICCVKQLIQYGQRRVGEGGRTLATVSDGIGDIRIRALLL